LARLGRSQINNAMIPMARIGRSKISSGMIPMARIGRSGSNEEMLAVFLPTEDFPGRDLKILPSKNRISKLTKAFIVNQPWTWIQNSILKRILNPECVLIVKSAEMEILWYQWPGLVEIHNSLSEKLALMEWIFFGLNLVHETSNFTIFCKEILW